MSKFDDLSEWSPKKLRTLRNNLNNRVASFGNAGDKTKELQKSHVLAGMEEGQCKDLLKVVQSELKKRRFDS